MGEIQRSTHTVVAEFANHVDVVSFGVASNCLPLKREDIAAY
jgi:hypothetical protein